MLPSLSWWIDGTPYWIPLGRNSKGSKDTVCCLQYGINGSLPQTDWTGLVQKDIAIRLGLWLLVREPTQLRKSNLILILHLRNHLPTKFVYRRVCSSTLEPQRVPKNDEQLCNNQESTKLFAKRCDPTSIGSDPVWFPAVARCEWWGPGCWERKRGIGQWSVSAPCRVRSYKNISELNESAFCGSKPSALQSVTSRDR